MALDFFFLSYRDPLFGLLMLVAFVFIIALFHYFWSKYSLKNRESKIHNFVEKFKQDKHDSDFSKLKLEELIILARVFAKEGNYDKSIELFLLALSRCDDDDLKEELFIGLAKTYLRAGFLQRAEEVVVACLGLRSRNIEALYCLNYINIKLKRYNEALQTCDALEILGEDMKEQVLYLQLLAGKKDYEDIKEIGAYLARFLYELRVNGVFAPLDLAIDLLQSLKYPINLKDPLYFEYFYAKNMVKKDDFNFQVNKLKMLKVLKDNGFNVKMKFYYYCKECNNELAIFSYHCPFCFKFASCKISYEVKEYEKD